MRGAGAVVDVAEGGKFARKGFGGVDGVGDLVVGEGIGVAGDEIDFPPVPGLSGEDMGGAAEEFEIDGVFEEAPPVAGAVAVEPPAEAGVGGIVFGAVAEDGEALDVEAFATAEEERAAEGIDVGFDGVVGGLGAGGGEGVGDALHHAAHLVAIEDVVLTGCIPEIVGDDAAEGAGVGEFRAGGHVPDENGVEDAVEVLADIGPRIHFDELADVGEGAVAEVVEEGALAVGFRVSFEV